MLFKSAYTKFLEAQLKKSELQISKLQQENSKLLERLLLKAGVPLAPDNAPLDPEAVERMVSSAAIFEEVDENGEEIEDNRKESVDAFAR